MAYAATAAAPPTLSATEHWGLLEDEFDNLVVEYEPQTGLHYLSGQDIAPNCPTIDGETSARAALACILARTSRYFVGDSGWIGRSSNTRNRMMLAFRS